MQVDRVFGSGVHDGFAAVSWLIFTKIRAVFRAAA